MIEKESTAKQAVFSPRVRLARIYRIVRSLRTQPGYTLMRGVARFKLARELVAYARSTMQAKKLAIYRNDCENRMGNTLFPQLDQPKIVNELRRAGVAFGLKLPTEVVSAINNYAATSVCYADRIPTCGFTLDQRLEAETILGKPILVAQYFNTESHCPEIAQLVQDPALQAIACEYLGSVPTFVGANLWWTFPVEALESDRDRHAHLFHRDVDDFRFFKFFFYLTDVAPADGAHVCVSGSHNHPPQSRSTDRWNIRRYTDQEIEAQYSKNSILEICGVAGEGFAENTLCVHKGLTPTQQPRLLLQLQFALFDYGAMHDLRESKMLRLMM